MSRLVAQVNRALPGALSLTLAATAAFGCARDDSQPAQTTAQWSVVEHYPHDPNAFTEGLEVRGDRRYESTGLVGRSYVARFDLDTGRELARQDIPGMFGEGITIAGDELWQLTYDDHIAIARDPDTLAELRRIDYPAQGWGICALADTVVTSDGTNRLTVRDSQSLTEIRTVVLQDSPHVRLNELECLTDGMIVANDFPTNNVVAIDLEQAKVTATFDLTDLSVRAGVTDANRQVLNGIAELAEPEEFLVTGKDWPLMFRIRLPIG